MSYGKYKLRHIQGGNGDVLYRFYPCVLVFGLPECLKVHFVKFLFGGSTLPLFYSVGVVASCNYTLINNQCILIKQ